MSDYVYLDYAATYPVVKYPQQLYRDVLGKGYFLNPNAHYAYKEKRLLSEAENRVKKAIGAKGGKVIFGGTSSQLIENLMSAITKETNEYHIVSSVYEHNSFFRFHQSTVRNTVLLNGFLETYQCIPNCSDQLFVMWQDVNNLTGEVFPTKQIGELVHKYNGFYICDGTAQIGHTSIESNIDDWCDFWCCSGHKAGTELGIGCCWVSDRLDKWLNGFKLHGTPNLAGALVMAQAVEDACDSKAIEDRDNHWLELYWGMVEGFQKAHIRGGVYNNVLNEEKSDTNEPAETTCAINAIHLPGFNARALQSYLASKEIYIGLGQSSCADEADRRILCQGYGLSEQEADEVIRISFGEDNSVEDVEALVEGIKNFKELYL